VLRVAMDAQGVDIESIKLDQIERETEEMKSKISDLQNEFGKKNALYMRLKEIQKQKEKEAIIKKIEEAQKEREKLRCFSCHSLLNNKKYSTYEKGNVCYDCLSIATKMDQESWGPELRKK
jgi:hypothetical protein